MTGDHIWDPQSAGDPEYISYVPQACTFATLRTALEEDNIMKPADVFVVGPGLLSTPSYERKEKYNRCWAIWTLNLAANPSSKARNPDSATAPF